MTLAAQMVITNYYNFRPRFLRLLFFLICYCYEEETLAATILTGALETM